MLLTPPRFGGIKERYTLTHAGEVHRLLDPIRKCFREFPDELHYENFLLHFLDPEVATILLGNAMPRHVKHAVAQPRKAQFYRFWNRGPVLHEIIVDGPAVAGERWAAPGIRVCTRTAREIRACTVTLEVLDAARRLMSTHVDFPLEAERRSVYARLAKAQEFVVGDLLSARAPVAFETANKMIVAVLRAVAAGACTIDWTRGPLSATTRVVRSDKPLPRLAPPLERDDGGGMVHRTGHIGLAQGLHSSLSRLRMGRGHGR